MTPLTRLANLTQLTTHIKHIFVNLKVTEQPDDDDDDDDDDKNDQPQTSNRQEPAPPTKTPAFETMLFPAVLDTGPSAEELIRVALQEKNNKRSFKDHEHFFQVFKPFMLKTLAANIEKFRQLYDYEHFINKIARTKVGKQPTSTTGTTGQRSAMAPLP